MPDCSIRSVWRMVQNAVDQVLGKITLKDLLELRARDERVPFAGRVGASDILAARLTEGRGMGRLVLLVRAAGF